MNETLRENLHVEREATHTLIEISNREFVERQVNSDVELERLMKIPQKCEIQVTRKASRPATANGSRPRSAKSEFKIARPDIPEHKTVLVKKISIEAPFGPVGFTFIQPPVFYKLRRRSNSLRIDNEKSHGKINKGTVAMCNLSRKSPNSLLYTRRSRREKLSCMDTQQLTKLLIK